MSDQSWLSRLVGALSPVSITRAPVGVMGRQDEASPILRGIFPAKTGAAPARTTEQFLLAYSRSPWLRAITSRIAELCATECPFELYVDGRRDGQRFHVGDGRTLRSLRRLSVDARSKSIDERVASGDLTRLESHPFLDLWDRPCPYFDGLSVRQLIQIYLDSTGEALLLKQRKAGVVVALWPLPSHWVQDTPSPGNPVFRVQYRGLNEQIPHTEILWLRTLDPHNPYGRGSGHAQALGDELDTDEYAAKYVRMFFHNDAQPPFVVMGKDLDKAAADRLEAKWLEKQRGFWRRFLPYFMSGPDIKIHEFQKNFQHLQLMELRQWERDICLQVFGVPPEAFGVLANSNRSTIDVADYLLMSKVVKPRAERLCSMLQVYLLPEYDERLLLHFRSPVREDIEAKRTSYAAASWGPTVDEWRMLQGLPPLGGIAGASHALPIGVSMVPSLEPMPASDVEGSDDRQVDDDEDEGDSDDPEKAIALPVETPPVVTASVEDESLTTKDLVSDLRKLTEKLEPKARKQILAAVEAAQKASSLALLAEALRSLDVVRVLDVVAIAKFDAGLASLSATLTQGFVAAGKQTAVDLSANLGTAVSFTIDDPEAVAWLRENGARLVRDISAETRAALRETIADAVERGQAVDQAARRIRAQIGLTRQQASRVRTFQQRLISQGVSEAQTTKRVANLSRVLVRKRAQLIARTEIVSAQNAGQEQLWRQAVKAGHLKASEVTRVWIVTDDDRLDEVVCEPMDGQKRKLGTPFRTGHGKNIDRPPAHPGCRCAVGLTRRGRST